MEQSDPAAETKYTIERYKSFPIATEGDKIAAAVLTLAHATFAIDSGIETALDNSGVAQSVGHIADGLLDISKAISSHSRN